MTWTPVKERLPADETHVLVLIKGEPRIGAVFWECPGHEDTHPPFQYWDDPYDCGQAWDWGDVTHWAEIPKVPE